MGKEESPQVTRRTTRFSASTPNNAVKTAKITDPHPATLNDLVFCEEPTSLGDLFSSYPGRRLQILELMHLLGPLNSPMLPLFLFGGTSTGKTSIILHLFRHLKRPFIYSSCLTCYSPRILFESILNQLMLHRKKATNGYSSAKRCEKTSDFINFLREALIDVTNNLKGNSTQSSSRKVSRQSNGSMIYLIFDNLDLVREKSSNLLPFLFKLYDILKMPEVGLIFISNVSPDAYYSNTGHTEPIPVLFPDYTEDDIRQIFMKNQANPKLYSSFLDVVLRPFCRITRRVDELSTAFSPLFKKYCEPLSDLGVVLNEEMKRRLFSHVKPHIAPSLNMIFDVPSHPSLQVEANQEKRKSNPRKLGSYEAFEVIDFHMSTSAKFLLISAFLASKNPATLDASFFDSTGGGSDSRKRKRKSSEKSMEQKETAEQELLIDCYREVNEGMYGALGKPMEGPNRWPEYPPNFKLLMEEYISLCTDLSRKIMRGIALALGGSPDEFEGERAGDPFWVMRLIGYPGVSYENGQDMSKNDTGCGAHTDYGLLTLVNQDDDISALQVRNLSGDWIWAVPIPGTFVCNIGDMLKIWSNGLYESTLHRVINNSPKYRVCVAFFYEPNYDATVEPLDICKKRTGGSRKFERAVYGEHLVRKVVTNFG